MGIQIQSVKKCGYLRQLAEGAKATASTFKDALLAAQASVFLPSFKTGRIVVSNSGGGQSGSFQMSGSGNDWTQDNIFGLIEEFLVMVEQADPVTYPDDGDPTHTDALRALIAGNIQLGNVPEFGITKAGGDFTLLYIPVFGNGLST